MRGLWLRQIIIIDSQNLNIGTSKDIYDKNNKLIYKGWKLDFKRFRVYLKDKYKVGKAFLFIGKMPDNGKLYQKLEEDGYILVFKPILEINGKIKGNCCEWRRGFLLFGGIFDRKEKIFTFDDSK